MPDGIRQGLRGKASDLDFPKVGVRETDGTSYVWQVSYCRLLWRKDGPVWEVYGAVRMYCTPAFVEAHPELNWWAEGPYLTVYLNECLLRVSAVTGSPVP